MNLSIETGKIDVFFITPIIAFIHYPGEKLELGAYIFNYFLTINLKYE